MTGVFDHPWLGGYFGDDEAARLWSPPAQLAHMLAFEAAWSRALGACGLIERRIAERDARAIEAFSPDLDDLRAGTARDGLPVPALVAQLRGSHPDGAAIHKDSTSQDVMDTALVLTIRDHTNLMLARLKALCGALEALDARYGAHRLTGRTRMQAALPITVADRIATWHLPLMDHRDRLEQNRPRVERVQIGGAAGDRAAFAAASDEIAAHVAGELRLGDPPRAWHARRDGLAEYAGCLSLITGTLGKMGQDVCLMAQQGIDEIALARGGGSSAMPHKQNPVSAELLVTLARFNAVQVSAMHHALVHEQERSGAAWSLEWMVLPPMALAAARALAAATTLISSVRALGKPA